MGRARRELCRDRWVVRDSKGVLHEAQVTRFVASDGACRSFYYSTACQPGVISREAVAPEAWIGRLLPSTALMGLGVETVEIVEWGVREETTCLVCIALMGGWAWA